MVVEQDGHSGTQPHTPQPITRLLPRRLRNRMACFPFERADQFALEVRSDDAAPSLAGQTAHVRDDDLGQSGTEKPLCERENRVFSLFCAVIRLDRRRCRAEHEQRVRLRRAVLCHIPRMVARRLLRAVRRVLLLVDDDNAEVLRGREHRRACAD